MSIFPKTSSKTSTTISPPNLLRIYLTESWKKVGLIINTAISYYIRKFQRILEYIQLFDEKLRNAGNTVYFEFIYVCSKYINNTFNPFSPIVSIMEHASS